jgi:hypothetical protein
MLPANADTLPARPRILIQQRIASALLPQRTTPIWRFISFEQFQISLPREPITIILVIDWHRTGGCHPISKSELPP